MGEKRLLNLTVSHLLDNDSNVESKQYKTIQWLYEPGIKVMINSYTLFHVS